MSSIIYAIFELKLKLLTSFIGNYEESCTGCSHWRVVFLFSEFRLNDRKWEKPFSKLDREVRENSKAYATLGEATKTIGHRLTGSVNGEKAEEYAFKLLKKLRFYRCSVPAF